MTPEQRQAWNAIYASYRGRSSLSDKVIGVDPRSVYVWNRRTEEREKLTMFCPVIVRHRVPIVIPESEMWEEGKERPDFVTKNVSGAKLEFIITKVDREKGFAVGSRRLASRSRRYFFAHREDLHQVGARIKCRMVAVGPRRCLVECYGHDIELTQREISYSAIPDLRLKFHPGDEQDCIVKLYDPVKDELVISIKETESNPFIGAEQRHPVGCRRLAVISGKYGGGVFCNLPDDTVCMCNYSYQHEDSDFMVGENVMLVVQRYDPKKKTHLIVQSTPKTKTSNREIAISDGLCELLIRHLYTLAHSSWPNPDNLLFPSRAGTHLDPKSFEIRLNAISKRCEIKKVNPHALRHTLATRLVEERTPLNIVQGILGHSSIETTRKYLHKNEDIEREAITSMTDYLNGDRFNDAPQLNGARKRAKFAGIPLPDFSQQERITANNT